MHRRFGLRRLRQPRDLRRRQHLGGVLEHARRGDDVARGNGHREVVVAILEIELALPEVRLGVPSAQVVEDADTRIPLRELVERAVAPHAVGAVLGNVEVPRDVERRRLSRRERRGQVRFHDRAFDARLERNARALRALCRAGDLIEAVDEVTALEIARAEARLRREDVRVERPVLERVLLDLKPDEAQRVRRVVGVTKRHLAAQRFRGGVERAVEVIVGALSQYFGPGEPSPLR